MLQQFIARFIGLVIFMASTSVSAQTFKMERNDHAAMAAAITSVTRDKVSDAQAKQIVSTVARYSERLDIDPFIVLAMMNQESTFNRFAKSPDGSYGLMQVHYRVHRAKFKGTSPFEIDASVRIGLDIFTDCLKKNKGQLYGALNCYSGGGGRAYYQRFQKARQKFERDYAIALFTPSGTAVAGLYP